MLLRKIPFFLFLLALFFCLHGSVENYGYLFPAEVAQAGAGILLGMAVLLALVFFFSRNFLFASLLVFFISLWYLFFGAIHDLVKTTPFLKLLASYTVLLPVMLLVNIAVAWWLKKNKQLHPKIFLYLNLLFIIFCLADGILLVIKHLNYKQPVAATTLNVDQSKVTAKPNVYFLLFDEYAGYKSLQDSFGFKNDSLYVFLQQQQFNILPVFSNYDFTPYSMSSVLNMQYVAGSHNSQVIAQEDVQQRFGEIRNAQVEAIFKSMGYKTANFSMFDFKGSPALSQTNGLFPIHAALLTHKIFHKRLLKDIGWWFVTGKFQVPFLKKDILYKDDAYNKLVEEKLLQAAAAKGPQPVFTYAHFFLPHGQYCRDSSGNLNAPEKISALSDKPLYLSYLKYTNRVMQRLVTNITAADPAAIIIIMSDHGFYDYKSPGGYHAYNFDNICMVKMPAAKSDTVNLPRSNVNFFRYFFNTAYGQHFPYVTDSTVFIIEENAFKQAHP
ncbi:MAG: sulfatase-like hydrolase/transferase [Ferruginibacter sp.]|nr:sulfatase-like hydrolase/transferase [Ferruginibacter sp.]